MAKLGINTGTSPNDDTGDSLLDGAVKINKNFNEVYTLLGDGTTLSVGVVTAITAGSNISVSSATGNVTITGLANTANVITDSLVVTGISTLGTTVVTSLGVPLISTGVNVTGVVTATSFVGDGSGLSGLTGIVTSIVAGTNVTVSNNSGTYTINSSGGGGGGITTANISADTLQVSGVSTFSGNTITNGRASIGNSNPGNANLAIVNTTGNNASFSIGQNVDGTGQNHLGIYYGTALGTPPGADIFTSNGNMSFWVDGAGGGAGSSEIEFGNAFGAGGGATWMSISSSGVEVTGVVTATSFTGDGSGLTGIVTSIVAGTNVTVSNNSGTYTINSSGGGGGGGISGIDIQDEGSALSTSATTLNFVGGGVVASGTGTTKTITIAGGGGGGGITTANISADTLQVSGVSTFSGSVITNNANLSIVNTTSNNAHITVGQNVDGTGQNHLGIYYGTSLGTPPGADIFTSNGNMSFWVDGSGFGPGGSIIEFGNAFGPAAGGATWMSISSSGLSVGAGVTYSGDASYITAGKWNLGANGSTDYTFDGPGFSGATNDPILYLARGQTYEFVNGMNAHPFQIRVSNGGAAYNTGVANNGTSNGTVRFEVPMDAPNTLYYQCTSHSAMGNTINIYPTT